MYHEYNLTKMEIPRRLTKGLAGFPKASITWSMSDMFRNPYFAFTHLLASNVQKIVLGHSWAPLLRDIPMLVYYSLCIPMLVYYFLCIPMLVYYSVCIPMLVFYSLCIHSTHDSFASAKDCRYIIYIYRLHLLTHLLTYLLACLLTPLLIFTYL